MADIAWAIAEHLHQSEKSDLSFICHHYHELNAMQESFPRIRLQRECEGSVEALSFEKLVPGGSNHSFEIHVAKLLACHAH